MKKIELTHFGMDGLTVHECDIPKPGPGEVLVRVHANSLNFRDLRVVQGLYDPKMHLPRVPFSDGAGEVAETGPGVTRVKTGDRVAATFFQTWLAGPPHASYFASALGGAIDGMLSEYVVLREDGLVHIPAHLSYEEAATLPCAALTAWNALNCATHVKPGDTVLIQGTGGVSLFALQFAQIAGAQVVGTSSSHDKLARAKTLGLSHGINYRDNPIWSRAIKQIFPEGVDHIIEVGGAGTFAQSLGAVSVGGHIAMIGILSGVSADIPTALILQKSARVTGIYVGSRAMFEDMNRAITLHQIKPVIDRVFGFTEVREALEHMESGAHFGKIVIRHSA